VAGPLAAPKSLRQVGVPVEATRAAVPADNPQNPQKIALGEELFFDGRLSLDSTVASSTCHDPARAFTDGRPVSVGVKGCEGQRNAPTILNSLWRRYGMCWTITTKAMAYGIPGSIKTSNRWP
jgi:cytochrome c peroxidase